MPEDLFDDPDYRDAALLGWLEGELRRAGWQHADALSALITRLMDRIESLEADPPTPQVPDSPAMGEGLHVGESHGSQ